MARYLPLLVLAAAWEGATRTGLVSQLAQIGRAHV